MKLFHKNDVGPSSEHMNFSSNVLYNSNSSSSLATVVWNFEFCNFEDPKKFKRTSFFLFFNYLSKASIFSRCNALYTILSALTPLLYFFLLYYYFCYTYLIMLSTDLILMRVASMQRSFRPAAPKRFPITTMKIHDPFLNL